MHRPEVAEALIFIRQIGEDKFNEKQTAKAVKLS